MRVIGRHGAEVHFALSGSAHAAAGIFAEGRVYLFQVPGRIVSKRKDNKDGMRCDWQIRASYPLSAQVAPHSFPHEVLYDVTSFVDLHQKDVEEFVDVHGTVVRLFTDALQRSDSSAKKEIAIVSGMFEVVLEL